MQQIEKCLIFSTFSLMLHVLSLRPFRKPDISKRALCCPVLKQIHCRNQGTETYGHKTYTCRCFYKVKGKKRVLFGGYINLCVT